jgi:hypothetical protein
MGRKKTTLPKLVVAPKKRNLSEPHCYVCRAPRPGGVDAPLPHGWANHCVDDRTYERGYWLPLTCSTECRLKGGFR